MYGVMAHGGGYLHPPHEKIGGDARRPEMLFPYERCNNYSLK